MVLLLIQILFKLYSFFNLLCYSMYWLLVHCWSQYLILLFEFGPIILLLELIHPSNFQFTMWHFILLSGYYFHLLFAILIIKFQLQFPIAALFKDSQTHHFQLIHLSLNQGYIFLAFIQLHLCFRLQYFQYFHYFVSNQFNYDRHFVFHLHCFPF